MRKLIFIMFLTALALVSKAQNEGYVMIDGLYYHYNDYAVALCPLPDGEYYKGDIYVPDYVTINGQQREVTSGWTNKVFHDCTELTSVSLPATFDIAERLKNNPQLVSIYLRGQNDKTGYAYALNGINIWKVTLYVDEESLDYYQSNSPFFLFHNIEVYNEASAIIQAAFTKKLGRVRYYDLNGHEVKPTNKGIVIVATDSGTCYKIKQ